MSNVKSREIQLISRPVGMPTEANFKMVEVNIPAPGDGDVLVRNIFLSVDPYMRGRMMEGASYVANFNLDETMTGGAIGQVIASNAPGIDVGDYVNSMYGWREYYVCPAAEVQKVDPEVGPIQAYLGTLGMPGLTAYAGLLRVGEFKDGETVFVSAASGAVGATVCQIAKARGGTVIGSAGSQDKCDWLRSVAKVDHVINYREHDSSSSLTKALAAAAPGGIDVYFENVGGMHLEAALNCMNTFGRIAACGMISQYNNSEPAPGPNNLILAVGRSLKIQGFIVSNHFDMLPDFLRDMSGWIKADKMHWEETVYEGIDNTVDAFLGLFKGSNKGKMLVKVGPDPAV